MGDVGILLSFLNVVFSSWRGGGGCCALRSDMAVAYCLSRGNILRCLYCVESKTWICIVNMHVGMARHRIFAVANLEIRRLAGCGLGRTNPG